jgi:hypothetical protein
MQDRSEVKRGGRQAKQFSNFERVSSMLHFDGAFVVGYVSGGNIAWTL